MKFKQTAPDLSSLGDELRSQLADHIRLLGEQRDTVRARLDPETIGQLYMRAHDLKGIGAICGFPVIGRLAAGICNLFDDPKHLPADQMGLVDDHLDAIQALFASGVTSEDDPKARQWLESLERDILLR
jgi:hypothetical protein